MTDHYKSHVSTHADDCWSWGRGHYKCAVREIERLREDAERYRWLRNPFTLGRGMVNIWSATDHKYEYRNGDDLDAAIDAARKP